MNLEDFWCFQLGVCLVRHVFVRNETRAVIVATVVSVLAVLGAIVQNIMARAAWHPGNVRPP
jgi:hypothetical protein